LSSLLVLQLALAVCAVVVMGVRSARAIGLLSAARARFVPSPVLGLPGDGSWCGTLEAGDGRAPGAPLVEVTWQLRGDVKDRRTVQLAPMALAIDDARAPIRATTFDLVAPLEHGKSRDGGHAVRCVARAGDVVLVDGVLAAAEEGGFVIEAHAERGLRVETASLARHTALAASPGWVAPALVVIGLALGVLLNTAQRAADGSQRGVIVDANAGPGRESMRIQTGLEVKSLLWRYTHRPKGEKFDSGDEVQFKCDAYEAECSLEHAPPDPRGPARAALTSLPPRGAVGARAALPPRAERSRAPRALVRQPNRRGRRLMSRSTRTLSSEWQSRRWRRLLRLARSELTRRDPRSARGRRSTAHGWTLGA
jgi:hypothetical protein